MSEQNVVAAVTGRARACLYAESTHQHYRYYLLLWEENDYQDDEVQLSTGASRPTLMWFEPPNQTGVGGADRGVADGVNGHRC